MQAREEEEEEIGWNVGFELFVDCLLGLVWFGLVWFGLVWFGLVWFGLVWFGLVSLVGWWIDPE
jgi:hypothetical protein